MLLQVLLLIPRFIYTSWDLQEGVDDVGEAVSLAQAVALAAYILWALVFIPANLHATVEFLKKLVRVSLQRKF